MSDDFVKSLRLYTFEAKFPGHTTLLWRVLVRGEPTASQLLAIVDDVESRGRPDLSCPDNPTPGRSWVTNLLRDALARGLPRQRCSSIDHVFVPVLPGNSQPSPVVVHIRVEPVMRCCSDLFSVADLIWLDANAQAAS